MASAADGRSWALRLAMCRRSVLSLRGRASLWSRGMLNLAAVHRIAATQYTQTPGWRRGDGRLAQQTCPRSGPAKGAPGTVPQGWELLQNLEAPPQTLSQNPGAWPGNLHGYTDGSTACQEGDKGEWDRGAKWGAGEDLGGLELRRNRKETVGASGCLACDKAVTEG